MSGWEPRGCPQYPGSLVGLSLPWWPQEQSQVGAGNAASELWDFLPKQQNKPLSLGHFKLSCTSLSSEENGEVYFGWVFFINPCRFLNRP